jgi:hypothetical protein
MFTELKPLLKQRVVMITVSDSLSSHRSTVTAKDSSIVPTKYSDRSAIIGFDPLEPVL